MSRIPRFIRLLHSGGRQIPHPNQGGAGVQPSIPPTSAANIPPPGPSVRPGDLTPPIPDPSLPGTSTEDPPLTPSINTSYQPEYTAKGKLIIRRPRRQIPVTLPSGHPEPPSYPPPPEYFEQIRNMTKIRTHPLWSFFHTPPATRSQLQETEEGPALTGYGSLDAIKINPAALLRSGRFFCTLHLGHYLEGR